MAEIDYYDRLGVPRTAGPGEIKRAYLAAAKRLHPDAGGTEGMFKLLQEAYDTLGDPTRRAAYDSAFAAVPTETPPEPATESGGEPALPRLTAADIPWWPFVDPDAKIHWRNRFAPAEIAFFVVGALWAIPALAAIAVALTGGLRSLLLLALLLLFVTPTALSASWAVRGLDPINRVPTASFLFSALLLGAGVIALIQHQYWGVPLVVVALSNATLPTLARRYAPYRQRKLNWRANVCRFVPEWDREAARTPDQEVAAEATFALLSQYLTHIPAARILRDPPGFPADVDHAVLCGRRLILISSVRWPLGRYTIEAGGQVVRDGRRVPEQFRLLDAVRACRGRFRRAEVHGVVLLWPTRSGQRVRTDWTPEREMALIGPQNTVTDIGGWLAADPVTIDRALLHTLVAGRPLRLPRR